MNFVPRQSARFHSSMILSNFPLLLVPVTSRKRTAKVVAIGDLCQSVDVYQQLFFVPTNAAAAADAADAFYPSLPLPNGSWISIVPASVVVYLLMYDNTCLIPLCTLKQFT